MLIWEYIKMLKKLIRLAPKPARLSILSLSGTLVLLFMLHPTQPGWSLETATKQTPTNQIVASEISQDPCEPEPIKSNANTIAVLSLDGYFTEKPGVSFLTLSDVPTTYIGQITQSLANAAQDDKVGAVVLNFEQPLLSWAQVDELGRSIKKVSQAGKKTYAYVESPTQLNYLLACQCDQIVMTPTGVIELTGLAGEALYFKKLFDKLGIVADFSHIGQFKSAAETLTESGPTENELTQINLILDSLYEHLLNSVVSSRKIIREEAAEILDEGLFTAADAKKAGLIDKIMYRSEFLDHIKKHMEGDIQLAIDYGETDKKELKLDNPLALMSIFQEMFGRAQEPKGDTIAVLHIDGPITSGESVEGWSGNIVGARTIRMALNEAINDKDIKGIVVRIDSPGGSATASDIIYRAIRKTAEVKPVVVSMGGMAASGGYYTACGGPTIMAEACTITGSIGVVGGKLVLGGLLNKIGITSHVYKRGRNADIFSITRPFNVEQRYTLANIMRDTYDIFKERVIESRGARLKGPIETLAQGKIYTGLQAMDLGLIDEIGGLEDAVKRVAEQAKIEKYNIRTLPRPKTLMELLDELLAQGENDNDNPTVQIRQLFTRIKQQGILRESPVKALLGQNMHHIWHNVSCLALLLNQEHTLLILPYELLIQDGSN